MSDEPDDILSAFAASLLRLDVPPACRDGVEANLKLLAQHARTLEDWLKRAEAPGK